LGTQRLTSEKKLNVNRVRPLFEWIRINFDRFISALPEPFKSAWNPDDADHTKVADTKMKMSASAHINSESSSPQKHETASMQSFTYNTNPEQ
jgi:hypothetical protein